jgi:hypothetical protein
MRRPTVQAAVLAVCGLFVTVTTLGCSASTGSTPPGRVQQCERYAIYAIQRHITATRNPPQCAGLTPIVVNGSVTRFR